ncbi:MAG: aminoacyl-histidine dipeptidase [Oscillospiraceae bacterium]|nr:aminoacyl-histidine dipeptidase [Oscillospiraceae bacterium]
MGVLTGLKPEKVFSFFEMLCSVPHGSGNTKQISDLCVQFAKDRGLQVRQDAYNNVVIVKEASKGYEKAPTVILQGHIDMVCAFEPDCGIDMKTDGLNLVVDGDWVKAYKTSLGGDNGIAVAITMAILDDDNLKHPRIEAVFTTDEETGMGGALGLDCSDLKGRFLVNMDSEEEGFLTVSCAGGVRTECLFRAEWEAVPADYVCCEFKVEGLKGGHSGAEIDKGRASATQLTGRFLHLAERETGLHICSMTGGTFTNVIPLYCSTVVALPAEKAERFAKLCGEYEKIFQAEYAVAEPGLRMSAAPCEKKDRMFGAARTRDLLNMMLLCPYGVQAMSMDIPGLVQTSLNLGVVSTDEQGITLSYSIRSALASQKQMLVERLQALCEVFGAEFSTHSAYPGWTYKRESVLRNALSNACEVVLGKKPAITATHGGLECGLFMEKIPGLDCVSLGPDLREVHSVRERLSIKSTEHLYQIMCRFLENLKA